MFKKSLPLAAVLMALAGPAALAAPSGPEGPDSCTFQNGATTCSSVGAPVVTTTTSSPAEGCTTTTTTSSVTTTYTRHRGTYNSQGTALAAPASTQTSTSSASTSCTPIKYEAEDLMPPGTRVQPDPSFSRGAYAVFGGALGDAFTATVSVPVDGTYDLTSGDCDSSNTGIYTLSVDGATVGSPTDTYNHLPRYCTGDGPVVTDHGTIFLTAGTHQLTQTATGTTSGGYTLAPDYFQFALQG